MKINRVESKHPRLNKFKDSLLGNIFYFIYLHWMVFTWILGLAISGLILLFFAEKLFPETVHALGYAMDRNMFDELRTQNHYHAAAFIMEQNPNFLKDSEDGVEYQCELADVYIHIGEYNKAEDILLKVFNADTTAHYMFKEFYKPENANDTTIQMAKAMMKFSTGITLTDLYEKMGDLPNQKKYYLEAASAISPDVQSYAGKLIDPKYKSGLNDIIYGDEKFAFQMTDNLFLRGAKIRYHEDKDAAIEQLQEFVDSINRRMFFSPEFKLRHITQLVDWKLKEGNKLSSYPYIYLGVALCESVKNINDDAFLYAGKLAEQCFVVGDMENGYKLMRLHINHLSQKYDDNDVERLKGNLLLCRYYQKNGQWEELTSELVKTCDGLKGKIADNFAGLSSQQREYLAASLREPFDLSVEAALAHPTEELANLCFDNLIFERGLLMRSDVAQRLAIEKNKDLEKTYEEWSRSKRELSYRQYMNGPGNVFAKWELERKIADLDKQLAKNPEIKLEYEEYNRGDIQKALPKSGYFVEFGDNAGNLYALVLPKNGNAQFIPLCKESEVAESLQASIEDIYTNERLTQKILSPVLAAIPEKSNVLYSVSGLFSQLSIPTMRLKEAGLKSEHIVDHYQMKLCSSPMAIVDRNKYKPLLAENSSVSLWGGIDYGVTDTISVMAFTRGLHRGEPLRYLPGSFREVTTLQNMIRESGATSSLHTGKRATTSQFLKESPTVLHISTHGSFDSDNVDNPLSSSFLFFANANPSWMNTNPTIPHQTGIINGIDIETMNLSNCQLVVLSACETGLGFSKSREGVYGLQRAFKLAGARSILMSMWSVNDAVTAEYMTAFYKGLLSGTTPDEAVRNAQAIIRQRHPSPADWGAFVLMD